MPDIFLSYNREDAAIAQAFRDGFAQKGLDVWWDVTLRSGDTYDEVTEAALRGAKAVVVLWSPRSVASRWVRTEATVADRNCTLVPAMIEPCERPIMFELTQTADLCHWRGDTDDPVWRAFLTDVREHVSVGEPQPDPQSATPPAIAEPNHDTRPSIAVLPFINRSDRTEDDIFALGMVEDLTAALSISRSMKVIASSATAAYSTGARDLRQIGCNLGVRYLLEGNIRRTGDDLRVTVQLVEAHDGDILWTQKFDRPLAEVAALQEQLVSEVAACLGVEVHRAEMEHALKKPGNITAWESILRAEASLARQTVTGIDAAIAEARRAIAIDPDYDGAYAVLAISLAMRLIHGRGNDSGLRQELLDVIAHIQTLDSSDPLVLARLATAISFMGKMDDALHFAERAVALNANLEIPHIALGNILYRLGRIDDAKTEFSIAERLAPNSIWGHASALWQSVAYYNLGQLEEALQSAEQALCCSVSAPALLQKVICLLRLDRRAEASEVMHRLRTIHPNVSWHLVENFMGDEFHLNLPSEQLRDTIAALRQLWDDAGAKA